MKRVGLIGVSGYARVHYQLFLPLAESGEIKLAAATVINPAEESEKCDRLRAIGARLFDDYQQMLDAEPLDLCVIPTGIALHSPMTCAALRAGTNVLVEKPAAATVQDVDKMIRASHASGRWVAVGYQATYDRLTMELKRRLLDGEIGQIVGLKARGVWPRRLSYYTRNGWAGRLRAGSAWVLDSPFSNAFSHYLNLMLFWAGADQRSSAGPAEVTAELYRARDIESADTAALRIGTLDGPELLFLVTHSAVDIFDPQIVVEGTGGRVTWDPTRLVVERSGRAVEVIPVDAESHRRQMAEAVLAHLDDPARFVCDLTMARMPVVCANAAFEASPITTIDDQHVQIRGACDPQPSIREISGAIRDCFERGTLFSENGVPWAVPGKTVSTVDYSRFSVGSP